MKAAVVFTYTRPWAGREAKAIEAFGDALTFWGKHAADGRCSEPQIYLGSSATGLMIIHGERETLFEILDTDDFKRMYAKASLTVPDVKYELFAFGEAVQEMMQMWGETGAQLGYM